MDLREAIEKRRSYRKFKPERFPDKAIQEALSLAVLAPNSSNTQTWDFHWVKGGETKQKVIEACLSQSAARTASHLMVVVANSKNWQRSQKPLIQWAQESKAHPSVLAYYQKLIPFVYRTGPFNMFAPFKYMLSFCIGLFRPIMRGPFTKRDNQEVAVKSAALACENFVLGIVANGGATCMMEGFDEWRLKRALKLKWSDRVVMAIGIGYPDEAGLWGPRYRLPIEQVVKIHE